MSCERGLRNKEQGRIQKLRLIIFMKCPYFEKMLSGETKAACQEIFGVKLGYTLHDCTNSYYPQGSEQLYDWKGRPWIEVLKECCHSTSWV